MSLTQPVNWINKPAIGYMINAEFSDASAAILMNVVKKIQSQYGDAVFCGTPKSLHITLLDWIAPLVTYDGKDKDALYRRISASYDQAMVNILSSVNPIEVHFNEVLVSPSTIYITGEDDGSFRRIRQQFLEKVQLLPDTKLPPEIIHSSLARFTQPLDLEAVTEFLKGEPLDLTQKVTNFRLVRSTREPLLEFEVIKRYKLA